MNKGKLSYHDTDVSITMKIDPIIIEALEQAEAELAGLFETENGFALVDADSYALPIIRKALKVLKAK